MELVPIWIWGVIAVLLTIVIGGALYIHRLATQVNRLRQDKETLREEKEHASTAVTEARLFKETSEKAETELANIRSELSKEREERAAEKASAEQRLASTEAALEELKKLRETMVKEFETLAPAAIEKSHDAFLKRANETFEKHKTALESDGKQREEKIDGLLKPVNETLVKYQKELSELEKARTENYGSLQAELKNVVETQLAVKSETAKLVTALRAQPKTRGRWGEETLRNAMELAGMAEHCDFVTEKSFVVDGIKKRPDVIVHMPGGRSIAIDAKVPMDAFLSALEATDDAERDAHLVRHASQVAKHVNSLAHKKYWEALENTPEFVAMFLPSDNLLAAAIERDHELFDKAIRQNILIVTPTTLIALIKAISYGWRQERIAENALKVSNLGQELYRRMATLSENIGRLGNSISASVRNYNSFVGSLESRVLPQARQFAKLDVEGSQKAIPELSRVETSTRDLKSDEMRVISDD